jgi:predicted DNA-binding ArsR family transcriptional regulator
MMIKKTRILNDPSELVTLIQVFESKIHKKVFDAITFNWMTKKELDQQMDIDVTDSIRMLKKIGLIEDKWRTIEPGQLPSKEYCVSYSDVQVSFKCGFNDLSDILMLSFKPYVEIEDDVVRIKKAISDGNQSMSGLVRTLQMNYSYIRAIARRSDELAVMGQRIRIIEKAEAV